MKCRSTMFPITTGGNKENRFQRGARIYLGKPNEPLGCRTENISKPINQLGLQNLYSSSLSYYEKYVLTVFTLWMATTTTTQNIPQFHFSYILRQPRLRKPPSLTTLRHDGTTQRHNLSLSPSLPCRYSDTDCLPPDYPFLTNE